MHSPVKVLLCCLLLAFCAPCALAAEPAAFTLPDDVTDDQLGVMQNKMACYAQILNEFGTMQFVDALNERVQLYVKKVPGEKRQVRHLTNGYSGRFDAALKKNSGLSPRIEAADKAMDTIADAYPRLKANLEALDQYFQRGNYKDDGGKKGQELGAALEKDFTVFMEARDTLNKTFDAVDAALNSFVLARFEKQHGKKFFWLHGTLMNQAKKVLSLAPPKMDSFDPKAFEAAFREFQAQVETYEAYIKNAGKGLDKEVSGGGIRTDWLTQFINTGRTLLEAKQKNIPRLYANHAEVLQSYYNNMVQNSNGMSFFIPPKP